MRRRAPTLCALLLLGACSGRFPYRAPPCSGEFANPALASHRQLHARVLLTHEGRQQRHELAVHAEPGLVSAVGLTPMGTLAYRVRHDADGVSVENRVGRYLGLDAGRAYDAIVRGLLAPPPDPASAARVDEETGAVVVVNDACRYQARILVVSDRTTPVAPRPR